MLFVSLKIRLCNLIILMFALVNQRKIELFVFLNGNED